METSKQKYTLVMLDAEVSELTTQSDNFNNLSFHRYARIKKGRISNPKHIYVISNLDSPKKGDLVCNGMSVCKHNGKKMNWQWAKVVASSYKVLTPNSWLDLTKCGWIIDYYNSKKSFPLINLELGYTIDKYMGHFHQVRIYFIKTNADGSVKVITEGKTIKNDDFWRGFEFACILLEDLGYTKSSTHPHNIADCLRGKMGRIPKNKIRKNTGTKLLKK